MTRGSGLSGEPKGIQAEGAVSANPGDGRGARDERPGRRPGWLRRHDGREGLVTAPIIAALASELTDPLALAAPPGGSGCPGQLETASSRLLSGPLIPPALGAAAWLWPAHLARPASPSLGAARPRAGPGGFWGTRRPAGPGQEASKFLSSCHSSSQGAGKQRHILDS